MTAASRSIVSLRRRASWVAVAGAALFSTVMPAAPGARAAAPAPAVPLTAAASIERRAQPGCADLYRVRLAAGDSLHVVVGRQGAAIAVSLRGPAGEPLLDLDSDGRTAGLDEVFAVALATGEHRLTIQNRAGSGRYTLRLETPRPATADDRRRAATLRRLADGDRQRAAGHWAAAQAFYEQAADLASPAREPRQLADALYRLGSLAAERGESRTALAAFRRILPFWRAGADAAAVLNAIGRCYSSLQQPEEALTAFRRAAEESALAGDTSSQAAAVRDRAKIEANRGSYQAALDLFEQAVEGFRAFHLTAEEASVLDDVGEIHHVLGAWQEEIDASRQALTIQRRIGDRRGIAVSLRNLGAAYSGLERWDEASQQFEAAIRSAGAERDADVRMSAANGLAYVLLRQGRFTEAARAASKAYALAPGVHSPRLEANTLGNLGAAYGRQGRTAEALRCFDRAAAIYRGRKDPASEAAILFGRAEALEIAGRLDESQVAIQRPLELIEALRTKAAGSELRAEFFAARQSYYELQVRILMRLDTQRPRRGYDVEAFEASETTRARTLLDGLMAANLDIHAGADAGLLRRESDLKRRLEFLEQERQRVALGTALGATDALAAFDAQIRRLDSDLDRVLGDMRRRSSRYSSLADPRPLTLGEIQRDVLDPGTLLLAYSLGEQGSYLWSIGAASFHVYPLPKRSVIEEAARKTYDALQTSDDSATLEAERWAAKLSALVLAPVAGELAGKRLLIVADGALDYVPFAMLPEPRAGAVEPPFLVEGHEIVYLPSASVVHALRQEAAGRIPAPKQIAVFADPVVRADDVRIAGRSESAGARPASLDRGIAASDAERSARDVGLDRLPRLPYTLREADAILRLVPADLALRATGFAATRELAVSSRLAQYRMIHFATHAFLDDSHPERAGLVLSRFDSRGRRRDGFLHVYEIYGLHLPADLVVLSACRTALGAHIRGEGLMGMTRGFMYAGASHVMVSLWNISDHSTEELMAEFYRGVLQRHLTPAAALRAAQLANRKRWRAPYHWAAFELQGDWR